MGRRTRVYKREELFELVWSRPMYQAAKHYGVSDVALRKMCGKLAIPIPERGHWNRMAAGHEVVRPTLSPCRGQTEIRVDWWDNESATIVPSPAAACRVEAIRAQGPVVVEEQLTKPHPLVASTAKRLQRAGLGDDGIIQHHGGGLAIAVSPANLQRALCIMDALIKALEARGHEVLVKDVTSHGEVTRCATFVRLEDELIEFSIAEPIKLSPLPATLTSKERYSRSPTRMGRPRGPTGNLSLTINGEPHRHWRDRANKKLEKFLSEFVAHLYVVADRLKQARALAQERRRQEEEAEQRRKLDHQRAANEKRRLEDFQDRLGRWRLARDIREYAADLRGITRAASAEIDPNGPLVEHLGWVLRYADEIDPLTSLRKKLARDDDTTEGSR